MTKEEILEKSREDNKKRDEMESAVFFKSGQTAGAVGGLFAALILIIESAITGKENLGVFSILLSMTGTMLLTKYTKLKKKFYLVCALFQLVLAVLFFVLYIMQLMG
ncbi:MAG: hypothetical protein J6O17_07070 [Eubacterium sp.]|nr:hypothetical protein [Eubacterium sp.]